MDRAIVIVCLAALAVCLAALFAVLAAPMVRRIRWPFAVAAVGLMLYAGAKHGTVTFPDIGGVHYLVDNGSFVDNDYAHIDYTAVVIPATANLYVYRREISSTNVADWIEHLASTVGAFDPPQDLAFPAATNYNWMVFSDWTPGPSVETNGVWHAYWGNDQRRHERLIPVRTTIIVNGEIIATPKSKADQERTN